MLNVSQATKNSYLKDSGDKQLTISFPNLNITLTNVDLVDEDFQLTEYANSGSSIEFIGCWSSVVSFTTKSLRTDVKGQYIVISVACDGTDSIPLFHGYVQEVEQKPHQTDKTITAYDMLYKLSDTDIALWYTNLSFPISIKDFRDSLFRELGITQVATTLTTDDIQIVRRYSPTTLNALDIIKSLCQINCVFGKINRSGEFEYRTPPNTSTVLQQIDYYKSATYQEYYVKPVDKLTLRFSDQEDIVYGGGDNNYVIVDNFFAKGLEEETLRSLAQSLFAIVQNFQYQSFEADVNALPYMECLDVVSLPVMDINTGTVHQLPYIILERTIKGIQALRDEIKAEGDEYQHVFESDVSIQLEELKRQIEVIRDDMDNLKFAYYLFTNADGDIDIADGEEKQIIDVYFSAKDKSVVTFNCEILLEVETTDDDDDYYDAVGKITYFLDGNEIGGYYPTETWQDGKHILHLYYYITVQDAGTKRFQAFMEMNGGSIHVNTANLKGAIYGQNLAGSDDWNGIIQVDERVSAFALEETGFASVSDAISLWFPTVMRIGTTDNVSAFNLNEVSIANATDSAMAVIRIDSYRRVTEDGDVRMTEEDDVRYTEGD